MGVGVCQQEANWFQSIPERLMILSQGEKWGWKQVGREKVFPRKHWLPRAPQPCTARKLCWWEIKARSSPGLWDCPGCSYNAHPYWSSLSGSALSFLARWSPTKAGGILEKADFPDSVWDPSTVFLGNCHAEVANWAAGCPFLRDSRMVRKSLPTGLEVLGRQAAVSTHRRPGC